MKTVSGLYLWEVVVAGNGPDLWVTTGKPCIATATKKAQKFVEKSKDPRTRGREILSITGRGTLDA